MTFLACATLLFMTYCIQVITFWDGSKAAGVQKLNGGHHGEAAVPAAVLLVG